MQIGACGSENENAGGVSKAVWTAVDSISAKVSDARLADRIQVQRNNVSVLEAIYHVVEHFAQHRRQIVFATRLFTGHELGFYTHLKRLAHGETTP